MRTQESANLMADTEVLNVKCSKTLQHSSQASFSTEKTRKLSRYNKSKNKGGEKPYTSALSNLFFIFKENGRNLVKR